MSTWRGCDEPHKSYYYTMCLWFIIVRCYYQSMQLLLMLDCIIHMTCICAWLFGF
ncbi:hypothetical protein EDC04DRAFT_662005 [Pisolithus marmoratus]|nr:hypothetical protein EDC04DRAFT_662005 [Pisolithus marmoratus]